MSASKVLSVLKNMQVTKLAVLVLIQETSTLRRTLNVFSTTKITRNSPTLNAQNFTSAQTKKAKEMHDELPAML